MNRREALSQVTLIMSGTVVGAQAFLASCSTPKKREIIGLLDENQVNLLNEIGETILPATTSSPGAKQADVGMFMNDIVTDCLDAQEQQIFLGGFTKIDESSQKNYHKNFMDLVEEERHDLLLALEDESRAYAKAMKESGQPDADQHYYSMYKQLTVWGFFSSEIGATKALRHIAVPGRYDGCIPLEEGQKAWS